MKSKNFLLILLAALCLAVSGELPVARAFIIFPNVDHWLTTASGTRTGNGAPITLTWSIVPDGTSVVDMAFGNLGSSNLISFLDGRFGGDPNDDDLTARLWFDIFTEAFGRWEELSGATYIYEPNDDGATAASSSPNGVLEVRGDIRIAGANIDGASNILAFNNFPQNGGDMVLDTADGALFGSSANDHRFLRNTMMHEHGHGFGLRHVASTTDQLLMKTSIDTSFDGPRLDEVRAVQYYFGDANEKSHGGLGNGSAALATNLGSLTSGAPIDVGSDANVPTQAISPTATDFVSVANLDDIDFYSFSVSQHSKLTAVLTPRGGQFTQALPATEGGGAPAAFNANARSDLTLAIFDPNGVFQLGLANNTGLGGIETLVNLDLPAGDQYYARITGAQDTIQLYELKLSVIEIRPADFDEDGDVDDTDLGIWNTAYGLSALGDADSDGDTDGDDFLVWQVQFTGGVGLSDAVAVPEPGEFALLMTALASYCVSRRRGGLRTPPLHACNPLPAIGF